MQGWRNKKQLGDCGGDDGDDDDDGDGDGDADDDDDAS